jgi:hypothetical protein
VLLGNELLQFGLVENWGVFFLYVASVETTQVDSLKDWLGLADRDLVSLKLDHV